MTTSTLVVIDPRVAEPAVPATVIALGAFAHILDDGYNSLEPMTELSHQSPSIIFPLSHLLKCIQYFISQ
ncbi:MAG TPA: hypothetical protein V6C78_14430 [Crinalium sp.]